MPVKEEEEERLSYITLMSMALTLHKTHFGDEALLPNLGICCRLITMV
jgi:hypothetical protein